MATGEGDAAGEGLGAGLGLVAGAVTVLLGEDAGDGDDVTFGEFELFPGSQPAAKAIARIVGSNIVVRRINFSFGLLIVLPRSSKIEKRGDDCPDANSQQWVFPQLSRRNLRSNCTETLVFEGVLARLTNAVSVLPDKGGTGGGGSSLTGLWAKSRKRDNRLARSELSIGL